MRHHATRPITVCMSEHTHQTMPFSIFVKHRFASLFHLNINTKPTLGSNFVDREKCEQFFA